MSPPEPPASPYAALEELSRERALVNGHTVAELLDRSDGLAQRLLGRAPAGSSVCLWVANGAAWIVALAGIMRAGMSPVLVPSELPPLELHESARRAGAALCVTVDERGALQVATTTAEPIERAPTLVLFTSGSTGIPMLVPRTWASLIDEGLRYVANDFIRPSDRLLLGLPLSHAYALGWLVAALIVGAQIETVPVGAVRKLLARMAEQVSVVALTPTLASQLARRRSVDAAPGIFSRLRLAMVGAGPVDTALDEQFEARFGLRLARNYGSSETGAVFAGQPPLPPRVVGSVMPGVRARIVDPDDPTLERPPGQSGLLQVALGPDAPWHDMGDLVMLDERGHLEVLGRCSSSIRRAERWVSPVRIAEVLCEAPAVLQARVRGMPGSNPGNQRIVAEVATRTLGLDHAKLLAFVSERLPPQMVPDLLVPRYGFREDANGKLLADPRFEWCPDHSTSPSVAAVIERLDRLGITPLLDGEHDLVEIVVSTGQHAAHVELLLEIAKTVGLIRERGKPRSQASGASERPYEAVGDLLTRAEIGPGARVLEIASRAPTSLGRLLEHGDATCWFLPIDELTPEHDDPRLRLALREGRLQIGHDPPPERWDACIVSGVIHRPIPTLELTWLRTRLREGGRLVVDDVFVDDGVDEALTALAWHDARTLAHPTRAGVSASLGALGARVHTLPGAAPARPLTIASW
ncbi:MAG: class I adenylate-forming enzyme family protein [Enhygromyxa sp.]